MRVLDGVSLTVEPGELVCLLGHSGCGKTTLLRIAAGVETPTSGRVLIDGQQVSGPGAFVEPERRGIGLMFQDYALFPHMSVQQNVMFGLNGLVGQRGRRSPRAARCPASVSSATPTNIRTPCPAASSSGWRWRARSRRVRACS